MPLPIPHARASDVALIGMAETNHLDCKREHTQQLIEAGYIELRNMMNGRSEWRITESGRVRARQLSASLALLRVQFRGQL